MSLRSVELADMVFTRDASFVTAARFSSPVTVWTLDGSSLPLLELARSASSPVSSSAVQPLVSVVVTSFNRPALLREAVRSVRAQTYRNLEIVIVDDGSTHAEMPSVLATLEKEGCRVVHQKNKYLGAARNAGARVARGQLLVFLDDDNVMLPTMVATQVAARQHSEASVVVNGHYVWNSKEVVAPAHPEQLAVWIPVGPAVLAGLKGNVFGNANFLIVKETFFALSGFTEDRAGWEDYEFHAKAAIAGVSYVVVPEPLMLYRIHDTQEQMSFVPGNLNFQRVLRAYKPLLDELSPEDKAGRDVNAERQVNSCAINDVSGTCTNFTITLVATGDSVQYLGIPSTPSVTIGGVTIPGSQYSWVAPGGGSDAGTWTISVSPPANIAFDPPPQIVVSFAGSAPCSFTPQSLSCGVCFHKDTLIAYENREYNLAELEKFSECRIPHRVRAVGVVLHTTCNVAKPLRLTRDHLVYTARGLVAAEKVLVGDAVFGNVQQTQSCLVTKTESEKEVQEYFGLNCYRSVVLADKVKTSTFGNQHTLPSLWMSWVGSIAGIHRASTWGDAIAEFAHRHRLI